jgi:starvation-inducible DNA-binding protein
LQVCAKRFGSISVVSFSGVQQSKPIRIGHTPCAPKSRRQRAHAFCSRRKIMSPKNHRTHAKSEQLEADSDRASPILHQKAREIQPYGKLTPMPIALDENVRAESVSNLNQILADTMTIRDMYKKHHWQVAGATFYQLHLLFDKHHGEQDELVDTIAERIQLLGGVSIAMAADVVEISIIPRPPRGREEAPVQISRLLEAHEFILKEARTMAREASEVGDDGTPGGHAAVASRASQGCVVLNIICGVWLRGSQKH